MLSLHPQAHTTPAVRQEIARSTEPTGVLAQRFSVSTETIRKWRKRGAQDCQDHSSRPHKLPWKATEEERALVSGVDEEAREVLIRTEQEGVGGVLVSVRDSGPGLEPARLEQVFEAFYTTKPSGLGMGLSICRSIIEAHGGRL